MSIAPEPYHTALMTLMQEAMVTARSWAREGDVQPEQIADLLDSLHNVPHLVCNWETCDEHYLKNSFVAYDIRWGDRGLRLLEIYRQSLARHPA